MTFRFEDRTVTSIAELLECLKKDQVELQVESPNNRKPAVWYRGLPSTSLKLLPTLYRGAIQVSAEHDLMNRFKQNAHEFLDVRPQGEWEWMLLARHHGLPSRLLDWSENPLVGLFFACNGHGSEHEDVDGVVWCLLPGKLNEVANIGDVLPMFLDETPVSSPEESLAVYKTAWVALQPDGAAERPPAAALSIRTNKRIQAQLGVFTIHHASKKPLEEWGNGSHLWKLMVPRESRAAILDNLRQLGVTELTLFPDLDNAAKEARRGY